MAERRAKPERPRTVLLAGGVGGAKLADGLQEHLGDHLTVVVNTADDTERHGLLVMPDHDTVMYTLAGLADPIQGWGIGGETYNAMTMLERYGEEAWFRLGDRDLATHIVRSRRSRAGERLTEVCLSLQRALGVDARILPMTDDTVRTRVRTDDGWLDFQDYFVRLRQEPDVREVRFVGASEALTSEEVSDALTSAELIVVAPSNPVVSVGPILAVPGIHEALVAGQRRGVRVVAVSGIVGGKSLKGPADRMLTSLGHESSALGVARLYRDLVDTFVLDKVDRTLGPAIEALGPRVVVTDTIMSDDVARARLAREIIAVREG